MAFTLEGLTIPNFSRIILELKRGKETSFPFPLLLVLSQNANTGKGAQLYWIDSISQDKIFTTHTIQLATKYKGKEYILHDFSTKEQNPDAMLVECYFSLPTWNASEGGISWSITLPNGESKGIKERFSGDITNEDRLISRIKGFMSEYNMRFAAYSGMCGDGRERIIEQ